MLTLNEVAIKLNDIMGFRGLLETYEDLASQKMQAIRGEILGFREYAKTLTMMSNELESDILAVIKNNQRHTAALFISSDKGLYGAAFDELGRQFADYLKSRNMDAYVVGKVGVEIMERSGTDIKYNEVASDEVSLANLWKTLSECQEVNIFHLRYDNFAQQSVDVTHISGDLIPKGNEKYEYDAKVKLRYIYEPSALEVAEVFAKEVLSFLAEQTMKEADLAKHAARLMYLDSCLQRNNDNLKDTVRQKMILTKRRSNKRQNARMINYLTRNKVNNYA